MFNELFGSTFAIHYVVLLVLSLINSVCISAAINIDINNNNIKNKSTWVILALLFNYVTGIIYLIYRQKSIKKAKMLCDNCNESPTQKAGTKKSNIICIILILIAIIASFSASSIAKKLSNIDSDTNYSDYSDDTFEHFSYAPKNTDAFEYFYDMNATAYIDNYEVVYFTKNGEEYIYEFRKNGEGLTNEETGEFHYSNECFVDENGYLCFDEMLYNENINKYNFVVQKDGKAYYWAPFVSWDPYGNLVDSTTGNTISSDTDEIEN